LPLPHPLIVSAARLNFGRWSKTVVFIHSVNGHQGCQNRPGRNNLCTKTIVLFLSLAISAPFCSHAAQITADRLDQLIMPVSAIMKAELEVIPTPEQALKQAVNYRGNGQYGEARVTALHGMFLARPGSRTYLKLRDEIDFELPVSQVKEWLINGETDDAREMLDLLADRYANDEQHLVQIESLQGSLASAHRFQSMKNADEKGVINAVRRIMRDYYREYKFYPPNYRVLNRILPPGHEALKNYEVVYFRSAQAGGYQLVLRNRDNHENLLTITATGLIE
jgi:hypothetical protein